MSTQSSAGMSSQAGGSETSQTSPVGTPQVQDSIQNPAGITTANPQATSLSTIRASIPQVQTSELHEGQQGIDSSAPSEISLRVINEAARSHPRHSLEVWGRFMGAKSERDKEAPSPLARSSMLDEMSTDISNATGVDRGHRGMGTHPIMSKCSGVLYHDPTTWPVNYTEDEIRELLEDHVKPGVSVDYRMTAEQLAEGELNQIRVMIDEELVPFVSAVDVEKNLTKHLNNELTHADVRLQERDEYLQTMQDELSPTITGKTKIVFCYAMRGSGKTQLIKRFVYSRRLKAASAGRVLVRCCDRASKSGPLWLKLLLGATSTAEVRAALCRLIMEHVEEVTRRREDASHYTTVDAAYSQWGVATKTAFAGVFEDVSHSADDLSPLILLDTCEILAGKKGFSVHEGGTGYTLLEELCFAIPSPHAIFVTGCNASVDNTGLSLTKAHVIKLPTLTPLSAGAHRAAIESWGFTMDEAVRPFIHELSGGLPRILLNAHIFPHEVTLGSGAVNAFAECFATFQKSSQDRYNVGGNTIWNLYSCLLVSSSRIPVRLWETIPLPPGVLEAQMTYEEAITLSLCAFDHKSGLLIVPPIIATDKVLERVLKDRPLHPRPSDLHPFLTEPAQRLPGSGSPLECGRQVEKPLLYALYARYLVLSW